MNLDAVDNLSHPSNRVGSNSWRFAQGFIWASLAVVVLSGWFVVTRLGLRQDLRVWDALALRFGEGTLFLTPVLLVGPLRLRVQDEPGGIILAVFWGAPFILLVGLGLRATSAAVTSAPMPVFAGFVAWTFLGDRPSRRQLSGYGMITAGLFALVCVYVQTEGCLDVSGGAALVAAAVLGGLHIAAASSQDYLPSSCCTHLLPVGHPLPASLFRFEPFEPGARIRERAPVSVTYRGVMMSVVAFLPSIAPSCCSASERQRSSLHSCPLQRRFSRFLFSVNGHHGRRQPPSASSRWGED